MLNLDLNALAVDSFDVNVASDAPQWTIAAGDEEGVTVVEGYSHDVTQPHVCHTTTTF